MTYDSTNDTINHMMGVHVYLMKMITLISERAKLHDNSKLSPEEKEVFDEFTPKLKGSTYGSDEYNEFLLAMKPALDHHYAHNRHHPEHFEDGIRGMNIIDILEMLCDWKAASERHSDGDLVRSIELNQQRFGYSDELKHIFLNSVELFKEIENDY